MTEIKRGSAQFRFAITDPNQLVSWLGSNQHMICVAFVGRSNVGKSSTINTLFGNKTARVSKTPGRTRAINIFTFQLSDSEEEEYVLFDLPGYGHAEVSKEMAKNWEVLMSTLFNGMPPQMIMINLQDARHPNQKVDKQFHEYLKQYPANTFLLFNKMDKLKKQKERAALNKLKPQLFKEYKWVKQIHFVSAESKQGIEALEAALVNEIFLYKNEKADLSSET
jgi:GTP-binding protein